MRHGDGTIQIRAVLDEDGITRLVAAGGMNIIANTALYGYVGDKTVHVLWIDARRVGGVGISIRIAVDAIKKKDEFVPVRDDGRVHWAASSCSLMSLFFPL